MPTPPPSRTQRALRAPLTRRTFLSAAGLAAVAAACSSDSPEVDAGGSATSSTAASAAGSGNVSGGVASADLYVQEVPQRFAFGVLRNEGDGFGEVLGEPVTIGFVKPDGTALAPKAATFRNEGLADAEREGIYTATGVFDTAGIWQAVIELGGEEGQIAFEVRAEAVVPAPGTAAPTAASPTTADAIGVDPICTREPPCPLHEESLEELIGAGTPVSVLFSTPARCQSRWCGPVLDTLLAHVEEYEGVRFVHVEIFKTASDLDLVPTVEAWGLQSEPWLFGIDAEGTIVGRIDGAFDGAEIVELLDSLVA